ncbi:MAG TPA: hypothetical protein VE824_04345 [Gaiellales bacterium]|nr:hypothetical protein [Gaiellales bacterium]
MTASRWPGVGALGFAVLWIAGVILAAPPGGNYSTKDLQDFTASGHRTAVGIGMVVSLVGVLGLLILITELRRMAAGRPGDDGRFLWATGLLSSAGFAIGTVLIDVVPMGLANGGRPIPASVTYMFTQTGFATAWGIGGTFLAVTLLALAVRGAVAMPSWLRWFTVVAGVVGLFSLAFFPFFILVLWALVAGIWLLVSAPRGAEATRSLTTGEATA